MNTVPEPAAERPEVVVNGTAYRWPRQPLVVVCIDGGDPAYLHRYLAEGILPHIGRCVQQGFATVVDGSMPSFTCPNNMSIITGTPVSVHGISGNYYLDTTTGTPVAMTGPELLRADTLLAGFADAGACVVTVTAKDKLRRQLAKGLRIGRHAVAFSAEHADRCTLDEHGIAGVPDWLGLPPPGMYSMELSWFVLEAGIRLLADGLAGRRPDISYLSLTDWVQHKWAPDHDEARRFYGRLDDCVGRLLALGATVALTADHGMSDKSGADGAPNVLWLQDVLDARFGAGETTVVCPITDAYVAHHGALGGFVRVWLRGRVTAHEVIAHIASLPGIEAALDRDTVCRLYAQPADREGDVAVIAQADTCIGGSAAAHDLSGLAGHRLRSHGGLSEAKVPFILSRPLNAAYRVEAATRVLASHHLFEFALNGTA